MAGRPSVRMEQFVSYWKDFHEILIFDYFSKICQEKFYAATPLIVTLSPGHSDITRFRPWSPIAPYRNHFDRAKKIPKLLRSLPPFMCLIRVQAFRDPLRGELPHVQIFMSDGPNPLT